MKKFLFIAIGALVLISILLCICAQTASPVEIEATTRKADSIRIKDSMRTADSLMSLHRAIARFNSQGNGGPPLGTLLHDSAYRFPADILSRKRIHTFKRLFTIAKQRACDSAAQEKGINSLRLRNPESINLYLGKELMLTDTGEDHPFAEFSNGTQTQMLRLVFHEGCGYNYFDEFEMRMGTGYLYGRSLPDPNFISTKGIFPGMARDKVLARLGNCYAAAGQAGYDSLVYSNNNDPQYFEYCIFHEYKLSYYRFGKVYP